MSRRFFSRILFGVIFLQKMDKAKIFISDGAPFLVGYLDCLLVIALNWWIFLLKRVHLSVNGSNRNFFFDKIV
jgi:hypothetical protein